MYLFLLRPYLNLFLHHPKNQNSAVRRRCLVTTDSFKIKLHLWFLNSEQVEECSTPDKEPKLQP